MIGLATCESYSSGTPLYRYRQYQTMTNNLDSLTNGVRNFNIPSKSSQGTPVWGPNCVKDAMAANLGWRSNAFKVVALLSNNDQYTTYDLSPDIRSTNIVPLFYEPTATAAVVAKMRAYAATLPSAFVDLGSSTDSADKFRGWSLDAYNAIAGTTKAVSFARSSTTSTGDLMIRTIPSPINRVAGAVINTTVTIGYPSGLTTNLTSVSSQVTVYGYGTQSYSISIVQPPVAYAGTVQGNQGSDISFTVSAISPSGMSLGVILTASPNGAVYSASPAGSTAYALNTRYAGLTHTFRPNSTFYGTTYVTLRLSDTCQTSNLINITIVLARVYTAPRGNSFSASIPYNSRSFSEQLIDFTSQVSDTEEAASTLMITLTSVPSSSIGALVLNSTSAAVGSGYYLGTGRYLRFVPTLWRSGTYSFTYTVTDPTNRNSTAATVTITVPFDNTIPTLSSSGTSFYTQRGYSTTFTVSVRDQDFGESLTLYANLTTANMASSTLQVTAPSTGTAMSGSSTNPFTLLSSTAADSLGFVNYTLRFVASSSATDFVNPISVVLFAGDTNRGTSNLVPIDFYITTPPTATCSFLCVTCSCGKSPWVRFGLFVGQKTLTAPLLFSSVDSFAWIAMVERTLIRAPTSSA